MRPSMSGFAGRIGTTTTSNRGQLYFFFHLFFTLENSYSNLFTKNIMSGWDFYQIWFVVSNWVWSMQPLALVLNACLCVWNSMECNQRDAHKAFCTFAANAYHQLTNRNRFPNRYNVIVSQSLPTTHHCYTSQCWRLHLIHIHFSIYLIRCSFLNWNFETGRGQFLSKQININKNYWWWMLLRFIWCSLIYQRHNKANSCVSIYTT